MTLTLVLIFLGALTLAATWVAGRRSHCPATPNHRHDWLYAGPTGPSYDRKCLACGKED